MAMDKFGQVGDNNNRTRLINRFMQTGVSAVTRTFAHTCVHCIGMVFYLSVCLPHVIMIKLPVL